MNTGILEQNTEISKKANLLLVDDQPGNLLALESILDDLDCELFKVSSGYDALRLVLKHDFALALIDVQMPDMNGFELAEFLRGRKETRHLPVIFVTAISKDRQHVFQGYETGAVDYLFKPLDANILRTKVQVFLELYQQRKLLEKRAEDLEHKVQDLQDEISRHQQVEETLRTSEEKFRKILEPAPDPVVVYDMNGRVSYLNPAFSRVFGWSLSESRGREIDFIPPEHLSGSKQIVMQIRQGATISGIETVRLTKDRLRVEVSISGAGFFDKQGTLQGSVMTLQDITARKKIEEEIAFIAHHDSLTGLPQPKIVLHAPGKRIGTIVSPLSTVNDVTEDLNGPCCFWIWITLRTSMIPWAMILGTNC